jgi:mannose-1-phosphate guanylyltransferase/mannose-1-phosphate guanylyltransferase/phosphomannomutase
MLLGAGLGTRLRPITYELPKPLVPVLGRPVMEHILRLLAGHGFERVICNLHYFPDMIRERFGDGSGYGVELTYSYEEELLGTAGGVRNVRDFFGDETFLIISGDALTDVDLTKLWSRHRELGGIGTLALRRVEDPSQLGVVIVGEDGRIQGFQEKPDPREALSDLGNCGIYVFEPEIFDHFPEREFVDWAQDVFPALLDRDVPFYGHELAEYWNDVGSLEEYMHGNFDALTGKVRLGLDGEAAADGVRVGDGSTLDGGAVVEPPVFVGEGCRIAAEVRLTGPVVIGDRCTIGAGSVIRDAVVWPGTDVAPNSMLIGAIAGERPLAERLLAQPPA